MRYLIIFIFLLTSCGQPGPYDESANAGQDIQTALASAKENGKLVLLNFGANWCPDCLMLAEQFQQSPLKELIEENFNLVKIDIGDDSDKNLDIVEKYGNPIDRGIPTIVVVDKDNNILTSTLTGELASARNMGNEELYSFFKKVINDSNEIAKYF